jgi:hypothetical protein
VDQSVRQVKLDKLGIKQIVIVQEYQPVSLRTFYDLIA